MIKLLIIDDDAYGNKYCRIIEVLQNNLVDYEIALTLEEAVEKMFLSHNAQYDAIILDRNFPEKAGQGIKRKVGEEFIKMMEEHKKNVPIIINSIMCEAPKNKLVIAEMFPWELEKLQNFLFCIGERKTM